MDYPYPKHNENQKDFATNSPKRENANELDDEMSEIEPLADQSLVMNLYKVHNLPALHQGRRDDRTYCV